MSKGYNGVKNLRSERKIWKIYDLVRCWKRHRLEIENFTWYVFFLSQFLENDENDYTLYLKVGNIWQDIEGEISYRKRSVKMTAPSQTIIYWSFEKETCPD